MCPLVAEASDRIVALSPGWLLDYDDLCRSMATHSTATSTASPAITIAPALALIALDGLIEQIAQEGWVVGGTTVVLTSTTSYRRHTGANIMQGQATYVPAACHVRQMRWNSSC